MPETASQPQTRRALRELERARGRRRRSVRGHETAPQRGAQESWLQLAASHPASASPPVPVRAIGTPATPATGRKRSSRRPLTVAAFVFAIGLAITSVVPMLALGQSATAAAATATGAQSEGEVQAWKASLAASGPQASRDAYSAELSTVGAVVAPGDGQLAWPFPFVSPISYGYGPRVAPMEGASTFHQGVDFDPGNGTPIQIIGAGTVTKVVTNPHDGLGVHVVVDHGMIDGHEVESWYCEMAPGSIKVKQGQKVKLGDIVGDVGVSGISTGAHLHFELHLDGKPVDPIAWLTTHAGQP